MADEQLQRETTEVLQRLVRFNTVNPPGNERAGDRVPRRLPRGGRVRDRAAGGRSTSDRTWSPISAEPATARPSATSATSTPCSPTRPIGPTIRGRASSPTASCGAAGALDMKSQVAAEAVAAAALARSGWRPAHGHLKLVFVADEETGGEFGAQWLTATHPDRVRCDMLINEGGGESFRVERPPSLRRLLRREGDLPLHAHRPRDRRPRLAAEDRRQRAAEARAGARAARARRGRRSS